MKALQRGASSESRDRERMREEKEMQRLMGAAGRPPSKITTSAHVKTINITSNPGFKKISAPTGPGGGWKTVGVPTKKSETELSWGNNGEDEYDPAYPTPA